MYDWGNTIAGVLNPISKLTALGSLGVAAFQGRWDDIKSDWDNGCLNPFNQSESVAKKAKVLGFYKGSTVVRQDIIGTCSIFGTIWAESGITSETLKHEFGHSAQERFMGVSYILKVAIPSAAYCWYDSQTGGSSYDYYSMPWERTADWLGGVNRSCGYKKRFVGVGYCRKHYRANSYSILSVIWLLIWRIYEEIYNNFSDIHNVLIYFLR